MKVKSSVFIKKGKFTEAEIKYLSLLELNEKFVHGISLIRKHTNIPDNGISKKTYSDSITIKNSLFKIDQKLKDPVVWFFGYSLIEELSLPFSWLSTMMSIIFFNVATKPTNIYPRFEVKFNDLLNDLKPPSGEFTKNITITIRECRSGKLNGLIAELKKYKKEIEDLLQRLPKEPNIKMKNIKIRKEALILSSNNNIETISKKLYEKYGDDKNSFSLVDTDTLRKYIKQTKNIVAEMTEGKHK